VKPNPIALLIEGDKETRRLLRTVLGSNHYRLIETKNGQLGLAAAEACRADVIILGLTLPDMDGLTVLKLLRRACQAPMLALSVSNREGDVVAALDGGANDYMTKPFSEPELLSRLRVLRRCIPGELDEPLLIEGDLRIDLTKHLVTLRHRKIDLTPTEEALLHALVTYAGKVVTGRYLLRSVWGAEGESQLNYLRVFMSHLRKKLDGTGGRIVIETTGSHGYRLLWRGGGAGRGDIAFPHETMELENVVSAASENRPGMGTSN
jgi:two-component system KDP operon response regulator KdpE